jgi:ribosomal protein S3
MRVYNSFDEIARDLRYLKLQQQVQQETMKLQINEVKDKLSAVAVLSNIISSIAKKAEFLKVAKKLLGLKK